MPLVPFNNLAAIGVINEVPDHATPMNAWTKGNYVTFRDGHIQTAKGYSEIAPTILSIPQFLIDYFDPESSKLYWVYPGVNDAGAGIIATFDGATHEDRTQVSGVYSDTERWNGAIVNGLLALNNRVDVPQMWGRGTGGVLNDDFEALTNWPVAQTCAVLRGFRNFFIALDITDTTADPSEPDRNPYEIKHSDIVDSYVAPEWAPTTTNRAGSKYIGEGGGVLVDCLPLRGVNLIYAEQQTWPMTYIGGNEVFAIGDKALLEYGILTQGCVAQFGAGHHFVATVGDIIVHDGANAESIIDTKVKDQLFADIDSSNYVNAFVVSHYSEGEIWFCYPGSGATYPNKVAKWNIKSGAWSFMALPIETSMIRFGAVPEGGGDGVWDLDTEVWDDDNTLWTEGNYNPTIRNLMMAKAGTTIATSSLLKADDGLKHDGTSFNVVLEKTGIIIAGMGQNGPISDPNVDKFFYEVWPRVEGSPVDIAIGTAQFIEGPYEWSVAQSFNPASDRKLDFRVNEGYYGSIRFTSTDVSWHLDGFDLGVKPTGSRG